MTGREFNRDVSKAKRQARHGPVVITSRGRAAHVLLTMEEYVALAKQDATLRICWQCQGPPTSISTRLG